SYHHDQATTNSLTFALPPPSPTVLSTLSLHDALPITFFPGAPEPGSTRRVSRSGQKPCPERPWFCPGESPVLCSGWSPATGLPDPLARRPLPGRRRSGGNHDLGFFCHISRSCRPGYE